MKVTPASQGKWQVVDEDDIPIAGPFDSNADAWRWLDREPGDPISRKESVAEWLFLKP